MAGNSKRENVRLIPAYASLSSFEQVLLQFVSVIYEPAGPTTVLNCLRRAGINGPDGNEPTLAAVAAHLNRLEEAGFLNGQQYQCAESLAAFLAALAVSEGRYPDLIRAVQQELPLANFYGKRAQKCWRLLREYRIGIHSHDIKLLENLQPLLATACPGVIGAEAPAVRFCAAPFRPTWFRTLPVSLQFYLLDQIVGHSLASFEHYEAPVAYLREAESLHALPASERLPFDRLLAEYLLWRGQPQEGAALIRQQPSSFAASGFTGCVDFLQGRNESAILAFEADLQHLRKLTGRRLVFFSNISGLFYILALFRAADSDLTSRIQDYLAAARTQPQGSLLQLIHALLEEAAFLQAGLLKAAEPRPGQIVEKDHGILRLFAALVRYWLTGSLPTGAAARALAADLAPFYNKAVSHGFQWLALNYAELLALLDDTAPYPYRQYAASAQAETSLPSLLTVVGGRESWQRRLQALISIAGQETGPAAVFRPARLAWFIRQDGDRLAIVPKEQKFTSQGGWSKGRPVALSRLYSGKCGFLADQDRRICEALVREHLPSQAVGYHFDLNRSLPAMIGHPLLFRENSASVPVEFIKGEPELLVEEVGDHLRIRMAGEIAGEGVTIVQENPSRFRIIEVNDRHQCIARLVGQDGLLVPQAAAEQLMIAIGNLSSFMTVHSAIAVDQAGRLSAAIREVAVAERICIQLLPFGPGFKLKMFVRPCGPSGPCLKPGRGVEIVMAEVDGQRLQARRNLEREEALARQVEAACPGLAALDNLDREWHLHEVADCLEILLELQELGDLVVVEWPEGERFSISPPVSFDQLSVRIRQRQNWFEVSGHLAVDEDLVLDLRQLLALAGRNPGRFIPLGQGQFLALTQELRRRLAELSFFEEDFPNQEKEEKGKGVCFHPLALPILADFTDRINDLEADDGWLARLRQFKELQEYRPCLPSSLQAELRDYQLEGFVWLARLAAWGVGACLADDMGLGKTLQALAIILARAAAGPTLVVAPTSVCLNWGSEAARFAPSLNVVVFGGRGRRKRLKELKGHDMLVTSYTLLQQDAKLLSSINWQTIVLDEAQAIKNMATKRSRAAMGLSGGFRLLLTGTPIENHLGELWNLFNFINPGLLGSLESFSRRFAVPIERDRDAEASRRLRRLVRPFILRRIKSQVLEELPPRTEIVLHVERSREEGAFYEALRRQALANLQGIGPGAGQNMQILAEIMRLRLACCNPRLVLPESTIVSSKLELFGKVVSELLENRHKVLVFSQFVGHLTIIRDFLEQMGVCYRYLDGSTPPGERQKEVEAFQAGQGDIFLISLKAGGLGLNLTAADYVIHMDPWWNPAVEDQASDRAHRIGQTRPVTIYRLVTRNSIEEKIVRLHNEKRELADRLLEGSDLSARVSVEDLLAMIRER